MSTGGTGGRPLYGMSGASAAQQSVDLAESFDRQDRETAAKPPSSGMKHNERQDKSFLASVKEALQPGDVKRRASAGDSSHDSGHGGIVESMKPGSHRDDDDDEHRQHHKRGGIMDALKPGSGEKGEKHRDASQSEGGLLQSVMPGHKEHKNKESRGSAILDALKPGDSRREDVHETRHERGSMLDSLNPGDSMPGVPETLKSGAGGKDPGSWGQRRRSGGSGGGSGIGSSIKDKLGFGGDRTESNYQYDVFPSTEKYHGPGSAGESRKLGDVGSTPRTSALDSQGSIGHQFTSEGAIGGAADKAGGPFAKEGRVGRHFKDTGAVGGKVQDTLGHGDATRKGK